jgi:HD-like signal output (HDOD) protein/GGDEF domain-containing protein
MSDTPNYLAEITSRAVTLYSRPSVAMELVRLAEEPRVDPKRLKECVAQDPALTCKILRIVNSSMFGLNRPVADINQAIGQLGIKRLKLLALGFNLPDTLFAEVAARELRWYWTNTLTRAVAARLLAEQLWRQPGDEAFTAGLLQDIGILILLRELGEPYARFLTGVIEERCHLAALEQDTLGFDHVQLSAAVLARWQLPPGFVAAIAMPKRMAKLARMQAAEGELSQELHLAELLMQLVGQGRLGVLPELLEAGKLYRGMTKANLATLVESLQPQVDQLGQVLSLELADDRDYKQTLIDAHRQMALLSEEIALNEHSPTGDRAYSQLLTHTQELSGAMQNFLGRFGKTRSNDEGDEEKTVDVMPIFVDGGNAAPRSFERRVADAAVQCRERREELSLLILAVNAFAESQHEGATSAMHRAKRAFGAACSPADRESLVLVTLNGGRIAAILPNCDREAALVIAKSTLTEFSRVTAPNTDSQTDMGTLGIGVATASVVPKNFDAARMIERAERCLSAARFCGNSSVKSIEV